MEEISFTGMRDLLLILLFTVLQGWAGLGVLRRFGLALKPVLCLAIAVLLGIAVFSFLPFLLQLAHIPLTQVSVFSGLLVSCFALCPPTRKNVQFFCSLFRTMRFRLKLYEWPSLLLIAFIVFVSAWRCWYYPPTPRDLTSGPEVIAEYAVKEHTMINSVFTVNLETTNNQFKPPFITCLQIIYKLAGFPFGQVWLCTVFVFFLAFLYAVMWQTIHPVLAGFLLVLFVAIPEMYAYTIMALFDYSNAVFFTLSIYFLTGFLHGRQTNQLYFSALLMGIATYIRSETLILAVFVAFAIVAHLLRRKERHWKNWLLPIGFVLPSLLLYLLTVRLYIDYYLPVHYHIGALVNADLSNVRLVFDRFVQVNAVLIFSSYGVTLYGYFNYFFLLVFLLDGLFYRRWSTMARNALFAVAVVYSGLVIIGHLLPLMDIENSTKRGLFKLFPLMLLYLSNSPLFLRISEEINRWENSVS